MKTLVLTFAFLTTLAFGQVTTSVQNGDFWSPLTWDCACFPQDGDSLVINHAVTLSSGIAFNTGQIYIGQTGSLDQGLNNFSFYILGGSLVNHGTLTIDNLLLDSLGFIQNFGTANLDSVWTRAGVWNAGTINTAALAHDEFSTFYNVGNVDVINNFYNEGVFANHGFLTVGGSAANCNISTSEATFDNDGFFCVGGDFLNCNDDTLRGDGTMYIGGSSTNDGEVQGNLLINTPTAGFSVNIGHIAGTVSFGTDACAAGIEEEEYSQDNADWIIFPNPATTLINSSELNVKYFIYDLSGKLMLSGVTFNGKIHIDALIEGTYLIQMQNDQGMDCKKTFIKL